MEFYLLSLYYKIIPILLFVFLGFISGKLGVERHGIVKVLFFIINPVVFFNIGLKLDLESHYVFIPIFSCFLSCVLCLLYLQISKRIWGGKISNLIAYSAGASNSGYLGLPIALALFGEQYGMVYMLAVVGVAIYEYTLGAYVMERGEHGSNRSLNNIFKIPIIYALIIGLIFNKIGLSIPIELDDTFDKIRSCYIVFGIMVAGISLSNMSISKIQWKFVMMMLSSRFIISPMIASVFIYIDLNFCHFYPETIDYIIMIISVMPPAVNCIFFATLHNNHYQEAAVAVLLGILIITISLPLLMYFLL